MSGAVNTVKSLAQAGYDATVKTPVNTVGSMYNTAKDGGSLGSILGAGIKQAAKPGVTLAKDVLGGVMGKPDQPANIASEDPAVVAAEAEKEKARAKRQAQIDILTDRPGRGGTVLTDQYTYNV